MSDISRHHFSLTVALNTAVGTTAPIDYGEMAGGEIYIPAASNISSLTYHVSSTSLASGNTPVYVAAQDASGSPVTQVVGATKAYPIPEALFGAVTIKIVADAAETVPVSLKG